jgi:geranylgeranyl reductase family protein
VATGVDVVVVGGGPSGAATAYELARRGRSVVVCEKAAFPREKSCGDGLTPRAVRALLDLGLEAEAARWTRVEGVRAHAFGRTRTFAFPGEGRWPSYGLVVPRHELDAAVLARAEAAGARVLHREVVDIVRDGRRVAGVVADGGGRREEVRAGWVVAADGAGGKVARALGAGPLPGAVRGLAVRQYFPAPVGGDGCWYDVWLDVRLEGRIPPGYGWVFPVGGGTVNAGIGFNSTSERWRGTSLHKLMDAFLARLPGEWEMGPSTALGPPRAGRLAAGARIAPVHGPGFVVVGDAAGWINPATGEGIGYAYEIGRIVGRHLDEALGEVGASRRSSAAAASLAAFEAEVRATYGPYYRLMRWVARAMATPRLVDALVVGVLLTRFGFEFTMTVLTHLQDEGRTPTQVGFRLLERLARAAG